jgi:glucokinase
MFLGIEIGGTKLQLGVGAGTGPPLAALERLDVRPERGAEGIREQILRAAGLLIERWGVKAMGVGFGGPVDAARGRTLLSNQIEGWRDFPLVEWCARSFGLPALLANDSDSAGVAEARFGAGRGHRVVFYNNVGSGIGGALIVEGRLYQGGFGVAAEIGHLRPGLEAITPAQDLESIASGWGMTAAVRAALGRQPASPETNADAEDLLGRCGGRLDRLNTRLIAEAAEAGNRIAQGVFQTACQAIGWALAQMITLLAPNVVVMGGGVSLAGEALFFEPLRRAVRRYVFPPLEGTCQIVPAQLGEEMVVHGVLALVAEQHATA